VQVLTSPSPVCIPIAILTAILIFFNSQAVPAKTLPPGKSLNITSDKMIAIKDGSVVEFTGNVRATQADAVLTADTIQVFFTDTREKGQSSIQKIVSTGHVTYTSGDRKALADQAVYLTGKEILILTGNSPKLVSGKSHVSGKKIIWFRKDDRMVIESDKNTRVQATFNPEEQEKGKKQ
jgi:lipopolysaccharide export system protein LptA